MSYRLPTYTSASLGLIAVSDGGAFGWGRPQTLALIETIHNAVNSLARDIGRSDAAINAAPSGAAFLANWRPFKARWLAFYNDNHTALFPSSAQARSYAAEYNGFETQYQGLTGTPPSRVPVTIRTPEPGSDNTLLIVGVAAGVGLVGLVGIGYLMSSVAKIYSVHGALSRNPRRRKRHRRTR